jgi:regulator of protease activity HflC (stomatin/prohibitin superfamily)
MPEKRFLRRLTADIDAIDTLFVLAGIARYAAFVSWAKVIVGAVRGEEAKEDWRTLASTGLLLGTWTLTSGAKVREMASVRSAAVEMRGLVHEATVQSEMRDRQAAERDQRASRQEARMLLLTKRLVLLAGLTLAAAIVTLVVAIAK